MSAQNDDIRTGQNEPHEWLTDPSQPDYDRRLLALWQRELPDIDASGIPLFAITNAVMLRLKAWQAELFGNHGLNLSDFQMLSALYFAPPQGLTPSQLRHTLWLTPGGVTRTIRRLEKARLLQRRHDPGDKRMTLLRLNAAGKRKTEALSRQVADAYRRATAGLSEKSYRAILDGMTRFLRDVDIH